MSEPTAPSGQAPSGQPAPTGEGQSTPEYVSKDEIRGILSGMLKSSLPKVVQDALGASLKTALDAELAPLRERLTPPKTEPSASAKPNGEPEADPKFVELEKKLAKLQEEARHSKAQAEAERKRSREMKAFGDLRQQLTGKVRAEAVDVVADLMRARGLVSYDDDANVSMKVRYSPVKGMPEEDAVLPLAEALPHWLASKDASLFLPPPSAGSDPKKRAGFGEAPRSGANAGQRSNDPISAFESQFGSLDEHI